MIGRIRGTVADITEKYTIIDTSGVGYKIYAPDETLAGLTRDSEAILHTHTIVREDALDLYGFGTKEDLSFFELLLSVSGVGPRSALQILSATGVTTLTKAIGTGDTSYLTKVSGIGKKTAEKIVIELRDKLRTHVDMKESPDELRKESDIIEALKALGYSQTDARNALREIPKDITETNGKIKEALKILATK